MSWNNLKEGIRTARKPHACSYCGGMIPSGTEYFYWVAVDGSEFCYGKGHLICNHVWLKMWEPWMDGELPDPADFRTEYLNEYVAEMAAIEAWKLAHPVAVGVKEVSE